jgi:signal transduction histidine kinase
MLNLELGGSGNLEQVGQIPLLQMTEHLPSPQRAGGVHFSSRVTPRYCMLHEFLSERRTQLIEQCRVKVVKRRTPQDGDADLEHGIPLFIEQLIKTLTVEQACDSQQSLKVSGAADGEDSSSSEIGVSAAQHGLELLHVGFTVDQVVHDYGDLCQAITETAFDVGVAINPQEFQTLNRCLDNAIADAVSKYSAGRELLIAERAVQSMNERLGFLAHELRNFTHIAALAFSAIKRGKVGATGATGDALDRSLAGINKLVDHALADVRVTARMPAPTPLIRVADFLAEIQIGASLDAEGRGCTLTVAAVDRSLGVQSDRDLLASAVGNLLQNAFKFTQPHSEVTLRAYAQEDRVRIDVQDCCGGLPAGFVDTMFIPFTQGGVDRSGLGLGLSICKRAIEAQEGTLKVQDRPGVGCVFTIDMPRRVMP